MRQRMVGADDEVEAVSVDRDGAELLRVGPERDDAQLESAKAQLVWNVRGQHAVHSHAYMRSLTAKGVNGRQQVHAGVLVGCQLQTAPLKVLELTERARGLAPQCQEALRVVA